MDMRATRVSESDAYLLKCVGSFHFGSELTITNDRLARRFG